MKLISKLSLIAISLLLLSACSKDDDSTSTAPVITVNDLNPMAVLMGGIYHEMGATAVDPEEGSVLVTTSGNVDTNTLGAYVITYSATDSGGLTTTKTRDVSVVMPSTTEECEIAFFKHAQDNSNVQISWDQSTRQFISTGSYSRIIELNDGRLMIVYSDGPNVLYRISDDRGATWNTTVHTAASPIGTSREGIYDYTNPAFVELSDGTWLYGYAARPNSVNQNGAYNFEVRIITSRDQGQTWVNDQLIYAAGSDFAKGAWEPSFLELPSGDVQVYFANEFPYDDHTQEISLRTSTDAGVTWGNVRTASYRIDGRDGMPVPILLQDESSIVVSIEDNGFYDRKDDWFRPGTVRTTLADNWTSGPVSGDSDNRNRSLVESSQIPTNMGGGAPFIDQMPIPSGEVFISVQSMQCRDSDWLHSTMRVYIGDATGKNFSFASTPFASDLVTSGSGALWNSIMVLDESTIFATSTITAEDPQQQDGIYVVKGTITRK